MVKQTQEMHAIIWKAIAEGSAKLIRSGLAFTVMLGTIGILLYSIQKITAYHEAEMIKVRAEITDLKQYYRTRIDSLEERIMDRDAIIARQAIEIIDLRVQVAQLQRNR